MEQPTTEDLRARCPTCCMPVGVRRIGRMFNMIAHSRDTRMGRKSCPVLGVDVTDRVREWIDNFRKQAAANREDAQSEREQASRLIARATTRDANADELSKMADALDALVDA